MSDQSYVLAGIAVLGYLVGLVHGLVLEARSLNRVGDET